MFIAVETRAPDMPEVLFAFFAAVAVRLEVAPETARQRIGEVGNAGVHCAHAGETWEAIRRVETEAVNAAFSASPGTLAAHYRRAVCGWQFDSETDARVFLAAMRHHITETLLAQLFCLGEIAC